MEDEELVCYRKPVRVYTYSDGVKDGFVWGLTIGGLVVIAVLIVYRGF